MTCLGVVPSLPALTSKRFVLSLLKSLLFILLLSNVLAANAQDLAGLEQGIKPYGSYEGGDIDSISMVNGSLTLHIPLISYPQRGEKLHVSFSLVYANPYLQPWAVCDPFRQYCSKFGYNLYYGSAPGGGEWTYPEAVNPVADFVPVIGATYLGANYTVNDPDGAVHLLSYIPGWQRWRSEDATGYVFQPNVNQQGDFLGGVLTDRQGNIYDFSTVAPGGAQFKDSNGNIVRANPNSGGVTTGWTDTLGRVIPDPGSATSTTNLTGCPASATSASIWSPPGPDGSTLQYKFCWGAVSISFNPPDCASNPLCQGTSGGQVEMVGLVLPNLTSWTFAYDGVGELTTVTLPTGGSISYTWTYISGGCVSQPYTDPGSGVNTGLYSYRRAMTSRTVNANDGTGPHTWNYALSTTNIGTTSLQTIVTDPSGNDTVHSSTALGGTCSQYETETDKYSGSHTSGTKLQTIATVYNYTLALPTFNIAYNVMPSTITTTDVLSGRTSQVTKGYDAGVLNNNGVNIIYGELLTETESDFGNNGTPGSVLRQTVNQYMAFNGPNSGYYLTNNLLSLPYTVAVMSGSGAQ
jgi:YD repeat-containing protein